MSKPNALYWSYNVPLQFWPASDGSPDRILNYSPRKARVSEIDLDEDLLGEQTREQFLNEAAAQLENLAKLMRIAASDPRKHVYYHDKDPQEMENEQPDDQ